MQKEIISGIEKMATRSARLEAIYSCTREHRFNEIFEPCSPCGEK